MSTRWVDVSNYQSNLQVLMGLFTLRHDDKRSTIVVENRWHIIPDVMRGARLGPSEADFTSRMWRVAFFTDKWWWLYWDHSRQAFSVGESTRR